MHREIGQDKVYREVQRFGQFWLWLLILGISGMAWYAAVVQIVMRRPFGNKPMPDTGLVVIWLIFGIGLPALFFSSKLITEVRRDGIYVRFTPLHFSFQRIGFEEIKKFEVRAYRAIREYGGWGIRHGREGKAYIVSGNRGVQLELLNQNRLLIGSERPDEFLLALQAEYEQYRGSTSSEKISKRYI